MSDRVYFGIVFAIFVFWIGIGTYNNLGNLTPVQPWVLLGFAFLAMMTLYRIFSDVERDDTLDTFGLPADPDWKYAMRQRLWPVFRYWRYGIGCFVLWVGYEFMTALEWNWGALLVLLILFAVAMVPQVLIELLLRGAVGVIGKTPAGRSLVDLGGAALLIVFLLCMVLYLVTG